MAKVIRIFPPYIDLFRERDTVVSDQATVRKYAVYDDVCVYNECNILSGLLFEAYFYRVTPYRL